MIKLVVMMIFDHKIEYKGGIELNGHRGHWILYCRNTRHFRTTSILTSSCGRWWWWWWWVERIWQYEFRLHMSVQLNAFLSMSNHASWTFDKCLCLCATSFNTLYFIVQHKNSRQHKKYEYEPWKCCSSIRSACLKSKLNTNCKIRRFLSLKWKLGFPSLLPPHHSNLR